MSWENPVTTWGHAGQTVPRAGDFNRIEGNTLYLKDEVDNLKSSVSNGKNSIATAITDMGQSASGGDSFATLANKIKAISNDANAVVGDVLSGKTFYQGGAKRTGNMVNRGAVTSTITTQNGQYTIPAGYHNGGGKITASFANLVAGNVKSGVNIGGVVGTLVEGMRIASGMNNYTSGNTIDITSVAFAPKFVICIIAYSSFGSPPNIFTDNYQRMIVLFDDTFVIPSFVTDRYSQKLSQLTKGTNPYEYQLRTNGFTYHAGTDSFYYNWYAFG
jgi:hypothetical protein